ncbi:hypothetical protein HY734_01405 [Candidatus Uhrbacteria bacterium]|nr:hypothetical protein [Candidatus Uhrbacteria bacterium]
MSSLGHVLTPEVTQIFFRGARVVTLLFTILFIHMIFLGSFKIMVASGKNEKVMQARRQIVIGVLGTMAMLILFIVASATITRSNLL